AYGGLGGLGGWSPFPMRSEAPDSQVVQSDDEWRMANPQFTTGTRQVQQGYNMVQLIPGADGYDAAAAAPWHQQMMTNPVREWGGGTGFHWTPPEGAVLGSPGRWREDGSGWAQTT